MSGLVEFMNGVWGRALRIVLGIAIVAYAVIGLEGIAAIVVAVVGLVPILMGIWGRCLIELVYRPARSAN